MNRANRITIGIYSRGVMDGMWLRSHPVGSGGIFSEAPFSQFQGPYKSRANFNRGKLDGEWVLSDREDNPMCEIPYVDGARHGVAKWYYPNGSVMRQVRFNEGSPDGLLQQWNEQNKLQLQEEFANGRRSSRQRAFYPNKVKSKEDVYQGQELVVDGQDDWWSARPAPFATVGERVQHGRTAAWYENNQQRCWVTTRTTCNKEHSPGGTPTETKSLKADSRKAKKLECGLGGMTQA